MSTEIENQVAEMANLVKEANDIISELTSKNADLEAKLASAPKFSDKYEQKVRSTVDKIASISFNGNSLIKKSDTERFVQGFKQPDNVINVLDQLATAYEKTASAIDSSESKSVGNDSHVKSASADFESPASRLAAGRVRM